MTSTPFSPLVDEEGATDHQLPPPLLLALRESRFRKSSEWSYVVPASSTWTPSSSSTCSQSIHSKQVDGPLRQGRDIPPHVLSKGALPRSQNQTCWAGAGATCQLLPAPSSHHCPRPPKPQRKLSKLVRRGKHLTSQQQRIRQHYSLARASTSVLSCFP